MLMPQYKLVSTSQPCIGGSFLCTRVFLVHVEYTLEWSTLPSGNNCYRRAYVPDKARSGTLLVFSWLHYLLNVCTTNTSCIFSNVIIESPLIHTNANMSPIMVRRMTGHFKKYSGLVRRMTGHFKKYSGLVPRMSHLTLAISVHHT